MKPAAAILAAALLAGCSSVSDVDFAVRHSETARPAEGVHVRAISLNSGAAPLPLDSDTIDEILAAGSIVESATTGSDGVVRLRLRGRVPHVVELLAPPLGPGSQPAGDVVILERFVVGKHGSSVARSIDHPGPDAYTLEVIR